MKYFSLREFLKWAERSRLRAAVVMMGICAAALGVIYGAAKIIHLIYTGVFSDAHQWLREAIGNDALFFYLHLFVLTIPALIYALIYIKERKAEAADELLDKLTGDEGGSDKYRAHSTMPGLAAAPGATVTFTAHTTGTVKRGDVLVAQGVLLQDANLTAGDTMTVSGMNVHVK